MENGKKITFLDTPGHAALHLCARGASAPSILLSLVVVADDGGYAQTICAINHQSGQRSTIVCHQTRLINQVLTQNALSVRIQSMVLASTAWGEILNSLKSQLNSTVHRRTVGNSPSAETKSLRQTQQFVRSANSYRSTLDKGKVRSQPFLFTKGTLNVQPTLLVKYLLSCPVWPDLGRRVKVGQAHHHSVNHRFERSANGRWPLCRLRGWKHRSRWRACRVPTNNVKPPNVSAFETLIPLKLVEPKSVNAIIKADVLRFCWSLFCLTQDRCGRCRYIVHSAVGATNESDVTLAEAKCLYRWFQYALHHKLAQQAEADDVETVFASIIYKVIEERRSFERDAWSRILEEKVIGEAVIRETFMCLKRELPVDSCYQRWAAHENGRTKTRCCA